PRPPHPPQPPGSVPAPPALPRNGLSTAALGASALLLAPVALVLSALALRRHRVRPSRGRPLAVAAAFVAAIQLAVAAVALPVALNWDPKRSAPSADGGPGEVDTETDAEGASGSPELSDLPGGEDWEDWFDLDDGKRGGDEGRPVAGWMYVHLLGVGDCFQLGDLTNELFTVLLRACDEPHEAEAFGVLTLGDEPEYPGEAALSAHAEQHCPSLLPDYALDSWWLLGREDLTFGHMTPSPDGWEQGDRETLCWLSLEDEPLERSVRGSLSDFDHSQRAFLRLINPLDRVLLAEPFDGELEDWAIWAETAVEAAETMARGLRVEVWDERVHRDALRLARVSMSKSELWAEAAAASDLDTLLALYEAQADGSLYRAEYAFRESLDLLGE
ncbi:hypothetical protein, partial [Streptomyces otsuchiensis]|uniref:hypothetical protein n=1 Tax=Streptomyces otsuchiensis TaxID=2681388 RepID=UPI0013005867